MDQQTQRHQPTRTTCIAYTRRIPQASRGRIKKNNFLQNHIIKASYMRKQVIDFKKAHKVSFFLPQTWQILYIHVCACIYIYISIAAGLNLRRWSLYFEEVAAYDSLWRHRLSIRQYNTGEPLTDIPRRLTGTVFLSAERISFFLSPRAKSQDNLNYIYHIFS